MKLLDGQRALITGAGSGIGKVMAQHFEKAGARIWICDADTNNLEQSLKENPDWNGTPCDVSEETQVDQLFNCLLYTSPSPRDRTRSRMPSSA